ncbi:MAG: Crp/Fnr family transcriptional regulator [Flavobacteriales bacterium]|nr:Crp/Fnr family transcriptional regulator [Crocinitomicaceae bacterium]NBX80905.1 Crp/Fnr family transcriptional regulator [Flavobacteriales bacterium]NCA19667.1 Crp/Fnr family transcriptional regulator [Crocinitomicaceae bacterium]
MLDKSHKHVTCSTCLSRSNSLLGGLCTDEVSNLENHRSCNLFKKNQSLFLEGSFPRGVFCINQGKVKVFKRGDEGKEQIIHIAKEGEIVGFRAMFSEEVYNVAAETLEESNICYIAKDDFLNMIDTNAALRNGIMKELSKELADRASFITNMAQKSVRERLAFALILLEKIYEPEPINLSREDMANFVGTATETLIRLLKDFKEEGLIEVHTRKMTVTNAKKLIDIAGK